MSNLIHQLLNPQRQKTWNILTRWMGGHQTKYFGKNFLPCKGNKPQIILPHSLVTEGRMIIINLNIRNMYCILDARK
jgi:hypothetical protein